MTLTRTVLFPDQIDRTLVDISRYERLKRDAYRTISSPGTANWVLSIIETAYENANDTVFLEKTAPLQDWDRLFRTTVEFHGVDVLLPTKWGVAKDSSRGRAVRWLRKRGFRL